LRRILIGACALPVALACPAADDLSVVASRHGGAVQIDAHATLAVPFEVMWSTLTDYDNLSRFIPGMARSRLLGYRGAAAIVEQQGAASFLFVSLPIDVVVESLEQPPLAIQIRVLKGNLRRLDGSYLIEPLGPGRYVLHWHGRIEPDYPLPPLLGEIVLRKNIEAQFHGMVREIERRAALQEKK
jgi:hypothetical protein